MLSNMPFLMWAIVRGVNTGCHSRQLTSRNWGYEIHTGCCLVWQVLISAATFRWHDWLQRCIGKSYLLFRLKVTQYFLNSKAYQSNNADHVQPCMTMVYPSPHGCFQQVNESSHKSWILEHDNEFPLLHWSPQSLDLN